MTKFFQGLVKPFVDGLLSPIRLAIWMSFTNIALICLGLFALVIVIFKLFAFDLLNFAIFGIRPTQSYEQFSTPQIYWHFLIVSSILWVLNFFIFIYKYSKEMDGARASQIFKNAFLGTFKGVMLLIMFHILILFLNILFSEITSALFGDDNGFGKVADNIVKNLFPRELRSKVPSIFIEQKNKFGFNAPNFGWSWQTWITVFHGGFGDSSSKIFSTALILLVASIIIVSPAIKIIYDVASRVFINYILFVIFPIIPAFSLNDNSLLNRWKNRYITNLTVISVFYIAFALLNKFIHQGSELIQSVFDEISFVLNAFAVAFLVAGSMLAFKKLSTIASSFIEQKDYRIILPNIHKYEYVR